MTQFIQRALLIVTEAARPVQRVRWTQLGPAGAAEFSTFTAPLSADGSEPPTHYGAASAWTADMQTSLMQGDNTGLVYYIVNPQGFLRFTNSPTAGNGELFTWQDALADMGLEAALPPGL